ncbi:Peptidase propeptide and YPEB domain-containing protein [Amphritea atlantica]|jgi:uncharacterized membrane protein YkoI|uniref:Peptidase propeptide and YPEB domain-containing protein n=1 Tax=Amphritea atlantica TaxID=355243 RepID=A0A1H9ENU3_9GAMM|nr:PepSY domain-containing protein [Amphritea atlantica]SEQ27272.1 Peptidase propeptide and YPEB domain-containing protein [Amphritea atlantica]
MFRTFSYTLLALLMVTTAATVAAAGVDETRAEFRVESMVFAANRVSLQQAAATARQNHGGKVVKAETRNRGGRIVHFIRLINNGRVKTIMIDAETGQELSP